MPPSLRPLSGLCTILYGLCTIYLAAQACPAAVIYALAGEFGGGHLRNDYFRFISQERLDPVVNPGIVSRHAHSIIGGSNFGPQVNTSWLQASACTTAPIKEDKSNYWVPTLYFQNADGSFDSVDGGVPRIYYFIPTMAEAASQPNLKLSAFPDDFQMLCGDPAKRSFDPDSVESNVNVWRCIGAPQGEGPYPYLPPFPCPQEMRMEVRFPSCWDGKNARTTDHKSHVTYGDSTNKVAQGVSFDCPSTHPIVLPRVFIEVYWQTNKFDYSKAKNKTQPFVLANGDTTGYAIHGDFANGWPKDLLQQSLEDTKCRNSQEFKDCSMFTFQHGNPCSKSTGVNEVVLGHLDALPGCNPVYLQPDGKDNCQQKVGFLGPTKVFTTSDTSGACQPGQQQQGCTVTMPNGEAPPENLPAGSDASGSGSGSTLTTSSSSAVVTTDSEGHSTTIVNVVQETSDNKGGYTHVSTFKQCRPKQNTGVVSRLVKRLFYRQIVRQRK